MGISIGEKHTDRDWGLICTDLAISSPQPKTVTVTALRMDGVYDLTDVLGKVRYDNRKILMSFTHIERSLQEWSELYSEINNYLHGKKMDIVLDNDSDYVWSGRCFCQSVKEDAIHSTWTIEADVYPYKVCLTTGEKSL